MTQTYFSSTLSCYSVVNMIFWMVISWYSIRWKTMHMVKLLQDTPIDTFINCLLLWKINQIKIIIIHVQILTAYSLGCLRCRTRSIMNKWCIWQHSRYEITQLLTFSPFLNFRDHLHFFVGQSLPSSSSTVCFQSCQLSVRICSYLLGCCRSISV